MNLAKKIRMQVKREIDFAMKAHLIEGFSVMSVLHEIRLKFFSLRAQRFRFDPILNQIRTETAGRTVIKRENEIAESLFIVT